MSWTLYLYLYLKVQWKWKPASVDHSQLDGELFEEYVAEQQLGQVMNYVVGTVLLFA